MTSIKLTVTGAKARAEVNDVLTSGAVGIPVYIQYDSTWDSLNRDFVCTSGKWGSTGVPKTILNVGDAAEVAHEVMTEDYHLYLGINGRNADGTLVIQTTWADCELILPGADADASPSAKPSLPIWAQLQKQISELKVNGTGGYYSPKVSQLNDETLQFSFLPSNGDMPEVAPITVNLPAADGSGGEDGFSPIAAVTQTDTGAVISITDAKGTTTATIANGAKGEKGDTGVQGPQGQKGDTGATGPQGIPGAAQTPLFAGSKEECTDQSKVYVLPDGMIYGYMTKTVTTEPAELYDPAAATLNVRHSGTPGSIVTGNGYVMTDYIPVDMTGTDPVLLKVTCDGFNASATSNPRFQKVGYYNSEKVCIGSAYVNTEATAGKGVKYEANGNDTAIHVGYSNSGSKESYYDQIDCVRIEVLGINSPATDADRSLITSITDPNAGGTTTETGWMSTGHAFVPADYEDRIVVLEDQVAKIQRGNSTGIIVPDFWASAIAACISKIKALQAGKHCITFPFFSDNHTRNGYSGMLIAKIMDACHIPFCFYGGDSIDSGYIAGEDVMIAQDAAFDAAMAYIPDGGFCRAVGNHDGFWKVSDSESHTYTRDQVYELFLREEATAQNKHFGEDGTYYYVEDFASKVRFVVMNTNGGSVDETQMAWLQDTALKFSESGWAVVIISHQPVSDHYHSNISNAAAVREAVANSGVEIIGWFSGHIHRDRIYTGAAVNTTDDTEGDAMGFTQVTITSDHTGIAYDDSTMHEVADDDQSHAIDFVTINRSTRTVNLTRLGIGGDRSFSY